MDREEGNTCGLGGIHGVRYALGRPSSPLLTRPFRFQNKNEWAQSMRALASPVVDTVRRPRTPSQSYKIPAEMLLS